MTVTLRALAQHEARERIASYAAARRDRMADYARAWEAKWAAAKPRLSRWRAA